MKKLLLVLAILFSFAIASHSDPPEGYQYRNFNFSMRDCHGQYVAGVSASISDTTWVDLGASTLTSGSDGEIVIRFLVPADPDAPAPSFNGIQVTFSAIGYQSYVYYLSNHYNMSIELPYSQ